MQQDLLGRGRPRRGRVRPGEQAHFHDGRDDGDRHPTGGRSTLCGISPNNLPEQYCWSGIGGWFGTMVKFAGYDGFILEGKASEPTYVFIDDDKITFHPAGELWGMLVHQTQKKLEDILGKDVNSIVIGPAGETSCAIQASPPATTAWRPRRGSAPSSARRISRPSPSGGQGRSGPPTRDDFEAAQDDGKPIGRTNPIQYKDSFAVRPHINFPCPEASRRAAWRAATAATSTAT
jgi:hypothetical protein